ncbi:DEAD/DEAH box helicase domain-containing protein [Hirschfeldia incana]|nr:DEAD/DEAH box helicase domain-containing protein [Hirschfeldia incana]
MNQNDDEVQSLWGKLDPESFGDRATREKAIVDDFNLFLGSSSEEEDEEEEQEHSDVAWIKSTRIESTNQVLKSKTLRCKYEKLVSICDDVPSWAQPAFKGIKNLNPVESQLYKPALFDSKNLLFCAPPCTGKINVAVLSILRQLDPSDDEQNSIIVYVAAMSALVADVLSHRLGSYQVTVTELSGGDEKLSTSVRGGARVIVTTPENWDIFTKKPDNSVHTQLVRLVIIDDILLLQHPTRGHVLEAVVARTLMQTREAGTRLVGLSPALQNSADVARFLKVDLNTGLFKFTCHCKPVVQPIGCNEKPFQSMDTICTDKIILTAAREHQVLVFVHSKKDAERTAKALQDATDMIKTVKTGAREFIENEIAKVASDDLKVLLPRGFALLHAGLTKGDRQIVRTLFEKKHLLVLISTRSEVWGMDLSAHTVVIKGTEEYCPENGKWMELSCMEIMRMLGVAQRDQGPGHGIIITGEEKVQYYRSLMAGQLPIESQFISKLADQLNVAIVLGTVQNAKMACDWLSHTYFYFCILRNPKLSGLLPLPEDRTMERTIADLIHSAAAILDKNDMIKYDRTNGDFQATELGCFASYHCIAHGTIATFNKHLKPRMTDVDIYRLLSLSEELKYVAVRQDERKELAELYSSGGIQNSIEESLDRRSAKINLLLQAYISRLPVESLSLTSDMHYIAESAGRLVQVLYKMVSRQGWAQLAKEALQISIIIRERMWSDQKCL